MEPIRDLTWMAQRAFGTLERFELLGRRVLAVSGSVKGDSSAYRYRLLFFDPADVKPGYAVNLETSILGEWVISEQEGAVHRVVAHLAAPLSYEDFRIRALERAMQHLEKPVPPRIPRGTKKSLKSGE